MDMASTSSSSRKPDLDNNTIKNDDSNNPIFSRFIVKVTKEMDSGLFFILLPDLT